MEPPPASAPSDDVVSAEDTRNQESSTVRKAPGLRDILSSGFGRIAFEYFNWRKVIHGYGLQPVVAVCCLTFDCTSGFSYMGAVYIPDPLVQ